jgi:hypothetical protein
MQTSQILSPQLTSNLPTTITTILTAPTGSNYLVVTAITFANKTGSPVTVQCSIYNGTTDVYLVYNAVVGTGDTLVLGGQNLKVTLGAGYSLRALAGTASAIDVTVSATQLS